MEFNRFTLNVIIRSVTLAVTALLMVTLVIQVDWFFTFVFVSLIFILQVYLLIKYLTQINKSLSNFLIHLREQNTSINFPKSNLEKLFKGLSTELEKINKEFNEVKSSELKKENLLNLILDKVGTGILVTDLHGNPKLYNKALTSLFDLDVNEGMTNLKLKIKKNISDFDHIGVGEQIISNIKINNITRRVLFALSEIREEDNVLKIYSFHDIDREMTDYELQSWNGLIRVLSHEIMNTLTPMSTVIDTLQDCFTCDGGVKSRNEISDKDINDSVKGLSLLDNRVKGLKDFIQKFREFSDIPHPEINQFSALDFFEDLINTFKIENSQIAFKLEINPESLMIRADQSLLQLVVINVLKNAIQASSQVVNPSILIKVKSSESSIIVLIHNNGERIQESVLKKVFLPFFTTKEEGSGIGLSLARQIVHSHQGNIKIDSDENGTEVTIVIPE